MAHHSWSNDIYTYSFERGSHAFRIYCENSDYGISISIPPDFNPNPDRWVYETALWSVENDTLAYNEDYNYADVLRFDTLEEVIAEIDRVFNLTQPPSMV